jgi:hypothetical protein
MKENINKYQAFQYEKEFVMMCLANNTQWGKQLQFSLEIKISLKIYVLKLICIQNFKSSKLE